MKAVGHGAPLRVAAALKHFLNLVIAKTGNDDNFVFSVGVKRIELPVEQGAAVELDQALGRSSVRWPRREPWPAERMIAFMGPPQALNCGSVRQPYDRGHEKIEAIIKPFKLDDVKDALHDAGLAASRSAK